MSRIIYFNWAKQDKISGNFVPYLVKRGKSGHMAS